MADETQNPQYSTYAPDTNTGEVPMNIYNPGPLGGALQIENTDRAFELARRSEAEQRLKQHMLEMQDWEAQHKQERLIGYENEVTGESDPEKIQNAALRYSDPSSAVANAATAATTRMMLAQAAQTRAGAAQTTAEANKTKAAAYQQGQLGQYLRGVGSAYGAIAKGDLTNAEFAKQLYQQHLLSAEDFAQAANDPDADQPHDPRLHAQTKEAEAKANLDNAHAWSLRQLAPARKNLDEARATLARALADKAHAPALTAKASAHLVQVTKAINAEATNLGDPIWRASHTKEAIEEHERNLQILKDDQKREQDKLASIKADAVQPPPAATNTAQNDRAQQTRDLFASFSKPTPAAPTPQPTPTPGP